jgi:hypothetical protein
MSYENHPAFRGASPGSWKTTATDQLTVINDMTLAELRAVAEDRDLAATVRTAADRAIKRHARQARAAINQPSTTTNQ